MHRSLQAALISTLFLSAGCAPPASLRTASSLAELREPVLLISIDGYRPDYLARGMSPTLARLAREGVRAEWMQPAFPSLTFPNHYTLVTGLTPDHHGIVNNTMDDADIPDRFSLSNRSAVADQRWWNQATPIWISADRAGLPTATMFWPGSEAPIHGMHPDDWKPFDASVTPIQRVDQILAWLDLPATARPKFLTLYFDNVDHQAHVHGPESADVNQALIETDAALARLVDGLQRRGIQRKVNLVIVSDHGTAATPQQQVIKLDDVVSLDGIDVVTLGPLAGLRPKTGHGNEVFSALLKPQSHMTCWVKSMIPTRFHYGHNPRVPPVVCLADTGWEISTATALAHRTGQHLGDHGFDNAAPEMRTLFVASGPAFACGVVLKPFPNVDVYPLLAHLLHIQPLHNDGELAPLQPALRDVARLGVAHSCPR
jgi:predicted AlkP superfamily pyrophosphatase or phosphodiesterase